MTGERYAVVGAGIVGLATARELARRRPGARVTVIDKEPEVGRHQTSHNSGVVHAGLYYPPGSLKARLCARGRTLLERYCERSGLPFDECGKVVVARHDGELAALADIESRARANRVPGLRRIDGPALAEVEPHARGVAALHSPRTAIVDFGLVARHLAADGDARLDLQLGFEVTGVSVRGREVVVSGPAGRNPVVADRVVLCAGLHSDRVARLAGATAVPRIVAFRGEYWRLVPSRAALVRGLIYPVPDPRYPFLGVHFTRRVDGSVDLGPNAVLALAREGYRRRDVEAAGLAGDLLSPAVLRMARANWRAGLHEMAGSLSKRVFVARAATLVPDITASDVERSPAGVRAQAVDPDGSLVDDFRIATVGPDGRVLAVVNAPSPAATSSLAIAEHICDQLDIRSDTRLQD
ncbi:MAG TPA: L-2-hydroxyglutarate oxidase [Acidimicrobiales bacterium]|nr:L-2-hydroxyglutarate oxidase [Acidimicrobiales bacterium]